MKFQRVNGNGDWTHRYEHNDDGDLVLYSQVAAMEEENKMLRHLFGPMLRYRHKKTGNLYSLLHLGVRLEKDGMTGERQAVYISETDGKRWVRPESEFYDKFELIFPQGDIS